MDKIKRRVPFYISPYVIPGLKHFERPSPEHVYMEVLRTISNRYEISINDILGSNRKREFVYCRQIFCYWMKSYFGKDISLQTIARVLHRGERTNRKGDTVSRTPDHSIIIHSISKFKERIDTRDELPGSISHIATSAEQDFVQLSELIQLKCL